MANRRFLITGGRVWTGDAFVQGDVAVSDGKVLAIGKAEGFEPEAVFDASHKIVSAGLVDLHTHFAGIGGEMYGVCADLATIPYGVTAAADASAAFGSREILDVFAVKNVVFLDSGIRDDHADFSRAERMAPVYGDKAIGIKMYLDISVTPCRTVQPVREVCQYAEEHGLIVMVHCSNSPVPMREIVETLRPGDILTHSYHGGVHTSMDDGFETLRLARQRGVVIDTGHAGNVHTNFRVLREAVWNGAQPDTISTDITRLSLGTRGGNYGLTLCMSLLRSLGMNEEAILRAVTSTPGRVLGQPWGRLTVGGAADIAVLDYTREPFSLTDSEGNTASGDMGYRCMLTMKNGEVLFRR